MVRYHIMENIYDLNEFYFGRSECVKQFYFHLNNLCKCVTNYKRHNNVCLELYDIIQQYILWNNIVYFRFISYASFLWNICNIYTAKHKVAHNSFSQNTKVIISILLLRDANLRFQFCRYWTIHMNIRQMLRLLRQSTGMLSWYQWIYNHLDVNAPYQQK